MGFFSVILGGVVGGTVSGAVSSVIGNILDTRIICPTCEDQRDTRIQNVSFNYLECYNCHQVERQFTNACDYTLDVKTNVVSHAACIFRANYWLNEGRFNQVRLTDLTYDNYGSELYNSRIESSDMVLNLNYDVLSRHMVGRSIIIENIISRNQYPHSYVDVVKNNVIHPTYNSSIVDTKIKIHVADLLKSISRIEDVGVIDVGFKLRTEYNDLLFEGKTSIRPFII